ncbi:SGNH hydrolase domain-containing protein [Thiolinea disciformis]|uniref:SGNH hydrolase domain-containing protein n=1 Tax=Thiolinea disciformis TaxID=125614 RepID=UPI0012FF56C5|nr:SGNH hydrolase domain-containing protein [Thiolinea disciformis]
MKGISIKQAVLGCLLSIWMVLPVQANDDLRAALLKDADTEAGGEYVRAEFLKAVKKPFDSKDARKKVLLVGDSHAQDLFNALRENEHLKNYQLSVRYIPTRCQMYLGNEDVSAFIKPSDASMCSSSDNLSQAKQQIEQADIVFLAASWQTWSAERLPETLNNLNLRPEQKLLVLGRKSFGKINARSYLRQSEAEWANLRNPIDEQQAVINASLRKVLGAQVFVDIHEILCGQGTTCPIFTPDLRLISFDGGHFTPAGAKYAGKLLFEREPLRSALP